MIRYLIKRLLTGLVLLFIYVSILFFTVQAILPGDYVSQFTLGLTPSEAAALRQELGLDTPLWQRYLAWKHGARSGGAAGPGPGFWGNLWLGRVF